MPFVLRRRPLARVAVAAILLALLPGCNMVWRRILPDPEKNQVIRVEKGERLYFDLEEDSASGCRWDFVCTDPDVEVTIDHRTPDGAAALAGELGRAEVRIRIHRGYDGPSDVCFRCRKRGERRPLRQFTISLFRRMGDCAFWK